MFVELEKCHKARVIKETVEADGTIKRVPIIEKGIAVRLTSIGAYIYNPEEQKESCVWAEWFPYNCKEGIKAIVYL